MPDPNLTISMLPAEEAHIYQAVRYETFRPTINKILYAREPSQETLDKIVATTKDDIINKGMLYLKCVDNTTNTVIAGARWRYLGHLSPTGAALPRTWEEVDASLPVPEPYPESNPILFNKVFRTFNANKKEVMGTRPHYVLDTLVTLPQHHRRGAGALLVAWGCKKADELGVEAFLEASLMGVPLYKKFGFVPVKEVNINAKEFGGNDEQFNFVLMVRPANAEAKSA
ncbi:acyl-CoA N-acyltransferase [Pleomassaria siparia CBS 279.74]|uniref:Acyl-CoA N-acyltransferase n=1 Tax=Pleomassaria siparia CBS 279.74 TaxID=1314801 RepID=A0A6G1KG33_9PLEO|nr:acyl-CoA N-acyltransferase [Pleomassaria siparia CBS 279.74]